MFGTDIAMSQGASKIRSLNCSLLVVGDRTYPGAGKPGVGRDHHQAGG